VWSIDWAAEWLKKVGKIATSEEVTGALGTLFRKLTAVISGGHSDHGSDDEPDDGPGHEPGETSGWKPNEQYEEEPDEEPDERDCAAAVTERRWIPSDSPACP
jgi:hypothetical protein